MNLYEAIWEKKMPSDQLKVLIERNPSLIGETYDDGSLRCRPIYGAAGRGDPAIVALLLDCGADANDRTNDGRTPLFTAVTSGHIEVCSLLLARGADPNIAEHSNSLYTTGATPLHEAAANDCMELVALLLSYGANPTAKDRRGKIPADCSSNPVIKETLSAVAPPRSVSAPQHPRCSRCKNVVEFAPEGTPSTRELGLMRFAAKGESSALGSPWWCTSCHEVICGACSFSALVDQNTKGRAASAWACDKCYPKMDTRLPLTETFWNSLSDDEKAHACETSKSGSRPSGSGCRKRLAVVAMGLICILCVVVAMSVWLWSIAR